VKLDYLQPGPDPGTDRRLQRGPVHPDQHPPDRHRARDPPHQTQTRPGLGWQIGDPLAAANDRAPATVAHAATTRIATNGYRTPRRARGSGTDANAPANTRTFPPHDWTDRLPTHLAAIAALLIPERRERTCPRAVKRARHNNYRVKKPDGPASTRHNKPATIRIHTLSPRAA
jgi:hypothetical protein